MVALASSPFNAVITEENHRSYVFDTSTRCRMRRPEQRHGTIRNLLVSSRLYARLIRGTPVSSREKSEVFYDRSSRRSKNINVLEAIGRPMSLPMKSNK